VRENVTVACVCVCVHGSASAAGSWFPRDPECFIIVYRTVCRLRSHTCIEIYYYSRFYYVRTGRGFRCVSHSSREGRARQRVARALIEAIGRPAVPTEAGRRRRPSPQKSLLLHCCTGIRARLLLCAQCTAEHVANITRAHPICTPAVRGEKKKTEMWKEKKGLFSRISNARPSESTVRRRAGPCERTRPTGRLVSPRGSFVKNVRTEVGRRRKTRGFDEHA
jgi:hypothetical protein